MRALLTPILLVALAGCDNPVTYSGYLMAPYFPFDGERTWEFASTDTSLDYKIVGTLDSNFETMNDGVSDVYTVKYDKKCNNDATGCSDDWVRSMRWSTDGQYGTLIWSVENAAGSTPFDPPLQITQPEMLSGDSVSTTTDGATWTSTFQGLDTCPVTWTSDWGDQCAHFVVDDGGAGHGIVGDWWTITQYNVVAWKLADDTGTWQLDYATYTAPGAR